jgi:hypothetical protein
LFSRRIVSRFADKFKPVRGFARRKTPAARGRVLPSRA